MHDVALCGLAFSRIPGIAARSRSLAESGYWSARRKSIGHPDAPGTVRGVPVEIHRSCSQKGQTSSAGGSGCSGVSPVDRIQLLAAFFESWGGATAEVLDAAS